VFRARLRKVIGQRRKKRRLGRAAMEHVRSNDCAHVPAQPGPGWLALGRRPGRILWKDQRGEQVFGDFRLPDTTPGLKAQAYRTCTTFGTVNPAGPGRWCAKLVRGISVTKVFWSDLGPFGGCNPDPRWNRRFADGELGQRLGTDGFAVSIGGGPARI